MEERACMKISIITVCLNAADSIEKTICSVLDQTYSDIEYIIVDGKSVDGTLEIAKKYASRAKIISEQDRGIYDAMNKGIDLAKGEYIYFLNSGDVFSSTEIISEIVGELLAHDPDLLCANVNYVYENGRKELRNYKKEKRLSRFWMAAGITVCHQGVFARTGIMKQKHFDSSYLLWGDQEFFAYCLKKKYRIAYTSKVICDFDGYGISSGEDKKQISRQECDRINRKYNRGWYVLFWSPKRLVRMLGKLRSDMHR